MSKVCTTPSQLSLLSLYVRTNAGLAFALFVVVVVVVLGVDTLLKILHYCPISPCFQHIAPLNSFSGRIPRRQFNANFTRAWSANFKMVWYVLLQPLRPELDHALSSCNLSGFFPDIFVIIFILSRFPGLFHDFSKKIIFPQFPDLSVFLYK
jgi:hypothetical protein